MHMWGPSSHPTECDHRLTTHDSRLTSPLPKHYTILPLSFHGTSSFFLLRISGVLCYQHIHGPSASPVTWGDVSISSHRVDPSNDRYCMARYTRSIGNLLNEWHGRLHSLEPQLSRILILTFTSIQTTSFWPTTAKTTSALQRGTYLSTVT